MEPGAIWLQSVHSITQCTAYKLHSKENIMETFYYNNNSQQLNKSIPKLLKLRKWLSKFGYFYKQVHLQQSHWELMSLNTGIQIA